EGRSVRGLERQAGERVLVLEAGDALLALRLWGAPALTLVVADEPVATLGPGRPAWPLLPSPPVSERPSVPPGDAPGLRSPGPLGECHDVDLVPASALSFPFEGEPEGGGIVLPMATWVEATALFLEARLRGDRFARRRTEVLAQVRGETKRLARLERNLLNDGLGLSEASALRRQAEALLAAPPGSVTGSTATVQDPRGGPPLPVTLDPRLSAPANADRLFDRARRLERARDRLDARIAEVRSRLAHARTAEERALAACDLADLPPVARRARPRGEAPSGERRYLTSRGLVILVGRSSRENHRITFGVAGPEDLWLHARDVPGAHVILRDNEGRARDPDLREAAEVAAYFSASREADRVDVHVTRRKHVRPAPGGAGRVRVQHSATLRVAPRDPEGRLRRR
ncbi:MAG TPA: NFACT RNA binding domain-containing protein, partial [Vicinamibacteria bacterium]